MFCRTVNFVPLFINPTGITGLSKTVNCLQFLLALALSWGCHLSPVMIILTWLYSKRSVLGVCYFIFNGKLTFMISKKAWRKGRLQKNTWLPSGSKQNRNKTQIVFPSPQVSYAGFALFESKCYLFMYC